MVQMTKRRLTSLSPISMKCGGTFVLKKETKSTFYTAIVERTMEGLLVEK